jgi:hypothetical protein
MQTHLAQIGRLNRMLNAQVELSGGAKDWVEDALRVPRRRRLSTMLAVL